MNKNLTIMLTSALLFTTSLTTATSDALAIEADIPTKIITSPAGNATDDVGTPATDEDAAKKPTPAQIKKRLKKTDRDGDGRVRDDIREHAKDRWENMPEEKKAFIREKVKEKTGKSFDDLTPEQKVDVLKKMREEHKGKHGGPKMHLLRECIDRLPPNDRAEFEKKIHDFRENHKGHEGGSKGPEGKHGEFRKFDGKMRAMPNGPAGERPRGDKAPGPGGFEDDDDRPVVSEDDIDSILKSLDSIKAK